VDEVNDWVGRIAALYESIRSELEDCRPTFRFEQHRTIIMSEEPMQRFAVPDRELPILDVLDEDQVIASFVPNGLWLIGSWGRIDVITRSRTRVLLALGGPDNLEWQLVSPENTPSLTRFDVKAISTIVSEP
jgi:hypothetical protein